jgi:ADP-heptose:LPS heptosyltransferase
MHYLHDNLDQVIDDLKKEDFDYIIDLHHNLRTLKVKKALGKQAFSFDKLNVRKWLLTALKINTLPDVHIVDRYMQTVSQFGVKNDGRGLDYFIPDNEHVKEEDIPASHLAGYIGLVIGGAHNTKKYPLHKWKQFCERFDHPVMLLGGKEDRGFGDEIAAVDPVKVYNACGKFNLNESADLVRRAKLIVSNDTGLMHVAAAFKKPVISLWGNTVPEFGMYPYKTEHDILEIKKLWCRPCSKIGYKKCPLGHFKCMEKISVDTVLKSVDARLRT